MFDPCPFIDAIIGLTMNDQIAFMYCEHEQVPARVGNIVADESFELVRNNVQMTVVVQVLILRL